MLDKILSFIAELISVRSGTIASGVTYTYRSGVCSVTANIMLTENTMTLLGTCPYRPAETIYSMSSALVAGTVYSTNAYLRVDTDGKVYGYRRSGTALYATATFVVAD